MAAAGAAAAAQEEWRNRQPGMSYRRLGRTNFQISSMVMGGNTITPAAADYVMHALDLGLNYLDTAPAYGQGRSEQGYGLVLKGRARDRFFLTTKVSAWRRNRDNLFEKIFDSLAAPEQAKLRAEAREEIERRKADAPDYFCNYFNGQMGELERSALSNVMERRYGRQIDREKNYRQVILQSLDESLHRMGTDHVDVLMCPHGCNTAYEMLNFPETFEAFETARKAGKARFLGVSAHSDPAGVLEAAVKSKIYSVAMVAYNIVNHRFVDPALEAGGQGRRRGDCDEGGAPGASRPRTCVEPGARAADRGGRAGEDENAAEGVCLGASQPQPERGDFGDGKPQHGG